MSVSKYIASLEIAEEIEKFRWNFGNSIYDFLTDSMDFEEAEKQASNVSKPEELKYGLSPRGAELYVAEWMRFLGFSRVEITPEDKDGGYDVIADEYIIQVKNWNKGWIGVSYIRELVGVATVLGKKPIFFFKGNISEDALGFAEKAEMPIFSFDPETASLIGVNALSHELANDWLQKKIWRFQLDRVFEETSRGLHYLNDSLAKVFTLNGFFSKDFSSLLKQTRELLLETQTQLQLCNSQSKANEDSIDDFIESFVQLRQVRGRIAAEFRQIETIFDDNQTEISFGLSKIYEANLDLGPAKEENRNP